MAKVPAQDVNRALCWLWVATLMAIHAAIYINSASVVDTARDLYWAWSIAQFQRFPLEGPALAHIVHLSPLWYYLLSIPLLFSSAWLGAALWAGVIASLQYPLAYLLGRRLAGTACGLIFAGLSALPAWTVVSYLNVNHVDAVETTTLFILLCTVVWWQTRKPRWLVLLPLAVVAGIHAHPTVLAAALIAFAVLAVDIVKKRIPWRWLLAGIALGCLPFVPYLVSQTAAGWPDAAAGGAYFSGQSPLANLGGLWAMWRGVWIGGPVAAWQVILDFGAAGRIIAWIQILLFSTGLAATAVCALRDPRARSVLAAWAVVFIGVALIRNVTPVWMTGALYAVSAGAAAFGLARLFPLFFRRGDASEASGVELSSSLALGTPPNPPSQAKGGIFMLAALPAVVLLTIMIRLTGISADGDLKLPNHAMADVKRGDLAPGESFGYFPAWARGRLAAFLCAEPGPVTVHGPASIVLEQSYALEARMRCGKENIYLGGQVPGAHVIGIIRHDADTLGLSGGRDIGSLRLFDIAGVFHPDGPVEVPVGDVYPPRPYFTSEPVTREITVPARAGEWLAVTNLYMVWMQADVEVELNRTAAAPTLETRSARYFHCADCGVGDEWKVRITAPAPEYVEIVTFQPTLGNPAL